MYYSSSLIRQVKAHIKKGGVIAYPTESCYGFGCDPFNRNAINKILKLKKRSVAKGLIVIASKINQLDSLINSIPHSSELAQYWPGFYTLILTVKHHHPKNLVGKHNKLASRVSRHPLVKQLCDTLNTALVSTSANKAGCRSSKDYRNTKRLFGKSVMVLPGTTLFAKKPSTIIDWATKKILR